MTLTDDREPTARDLMSQTESIDESETVEGAAKRLIEFGLPALPVIGVDGVRGMFTNRHVVAVLAGGDPRLVTVGDAVRGGATVAAEAGLEEVSVLLAEEARLPVVQGRRLVGLITRAEVDTYAALAKELGPNLVRLKLDLPTGDYPRHRFYKGAHLRAGLSALECVKRVVSNPHRILDLPCGYGRVLCMFAAAFPEAELTACDLNRADVDRCARTFGATPIYGEEDPRGLALGQFDLIWCGSLFTHLDADRWRWFLEVFHRSLAPGGVLVLTTHSPKRTRTVAKAGISARALDQLAVEGGGFSYLDYEGQAGYGLAFATPDWVRRLLDEEGFEVLDFQPRGWYAPAPNQDVFSVRVAASP